MADDAGEGAAPTAEVTRLLQAWGAGDDSARDRLIPLVYAQLRRLARRSMRRERSGHTLQTTAVVNEAYLRLVDQRNVRWQNRAHFFAIAAQMMRRILVDYARRRRYAKREGELRKEPLEEAALLSTERAAEMVALDEALTSLAALNARQSRVVELRYFGGMTVEETAEAMDLSVDMVKRDWALARAWLYRQLAGEDRSNPRTGPR
jgi:RNA polymerase sigma factor (TIGR02999 family)